MPIYEYECDKCHRRGSVLTLRVSAKVKPVCDKCGSTAMRRLMSRFAMPRSEEARMDALSDPSNFGDLDESDPQSLARARCAGWAARWVTSSAARNSTTPSMNSKAAATWAAMTAIPAAGTTTSEGCIPVSAPRGAARAICN